MELGASYASLRGRTVVVTGGASGIGEAIVTAFVEQGAKVHFLDVQEGRARQDAVYYRCDLTDTDALRRTVAEIEPVEVLVNNAGNDTRHSIEEVTPEYWDRAIAINLKQQFFMAQAVIPGMKKAGRGAIINMSSISWAIPSTGLPVYVTAKAGIVGMTRTLAHELGRHNIRVNCVMPGAITTERQKKLWYTDEYVAEILANQALKRMIEPEEVARLVLFLASDDSSAITNQSLVIDAGWI